MVRIDSELLNYINERNGILATIRNDSPERVVFIKGVDGTGKTSLLQWLRLRAPGTVIFNETFNEQSDPELIMSRIAHFLGRNSFLQFESKRKRSGDNIVTANRNIIIGMLIRVVATSGETPRELSAYYNDLTQEFCACLRSVCAGRSESLVMCFDGYDDAPTQVKGWLEEFLSWVEVLDGVRVFVSGTEVPKIHELKWGHLCKEIRLNGVMDADEWLGLCHRLGRQTPEGSDPSSYMKGVVNSLYGNPRKIMSFIESLELRNGQ
jgi:hypothetical protein